MRAVSAALPALILFRRGKVFCGAILLFLSYQSHAKGQGASDDVARRHFEAARQAEKSGDLDKAAAEYEAVLATNPDVAEVRTNLGLIYYRQGKNDAAVKAAIIRQATGKGLFKCHDSTPLQP